MVSVNQHTLTPAERRLYWKNKTLQLLRSPRFVMGWIFVIVFAYLILVPLGDIIISTFQVQEGDARRVGAEVGEWTMYYWERTLTGPLSQRIFWEPLRNTLFITFSYTALAMLIGIALAWLIVKTDMPFRKFIGVVAIIPYILPSWTLALAWTTLFGNHRVGVGAAGVIQNFFGVVPPDWLGYGPLPIISVLSINYFAYTFLLASSAFATIDSRLEEAAMLHGIPQRTIMRSITLPIILPALGSAFILTFAKGIGTFGVPAFLGIPVRYNVVATSLYQAAGMGRFGDAFALTLILVLMAALAIFMNNVLIGKRKQFTTMTGKGSSYRRVPLGKYRYPVAFSVSAFVGITAFLPILLLVWQSFQLNLGDFSVSNLTLTYWTGYIDGMEGILVSSRVRGAAWNSFRFGLIVATSTAFVGILIGYVVAKGRGTLQAKLVEQMSFIPYVIPGIAFGAIYLTMFAQPRGPIPALYGTIWIVILAFCVNRLPFASRSGIAAMMQIGGSLEEAAEMHGAGFWTRIRRIMFPLSKKGFLTGFILSFISTIKDLSLVILLVTPQTMVLTALTFGYIEMGRRQFADAIGVVIVILVLGCTFLAQWITKTNPLQGFGDR